MEVKPSTPFIHPLFGLSLLYESFCLQNGAAKHGQVPTLLFTAGPNDKYVQTVGIRDWVEQVNQGEGRKGRVWAYELAEEFHALHWGSHQAAIEQQIEAFLLGTLLFVKIT